jgi:hypothetical protein
MYIKMTFRQEIRCAAKKNFGKNDNEILPTITNFH